MQTLIRGGRVIDPSSGVDGVMDLLVDGDRVGARGPDLSAPHAQVVDARGSLVLPGFIDMHTHSDFTMDLEPHAPARLHQGVTTDVTGNCGFSSFPLPEQSGYGSFFRGQPVAGHRTLVAFAETLEEREPAINLAPMVGLGTIRTFVMGVATEPATVAQRGRMRDLVAQALGHGAFGVSTGLVYSPGRSMAAEEIVDVLWPLAEHGRIYATHIRDERDEVVSAVEEAISIAEQLGVPLQLSHHKAVGSANWGRTASTLRLVDAANERGRTQVSLDYYPFTVGSTGLSSLLPSDALSRGWSRFRSSATDPDYRGRLLEHIRSGAQFRPDEVILGRSRSWPEASGLPVTRLAEKADTSPEEAILRLLLAEGELITMLVPAASAIDLHAVAAHPRAVHGSDAWLMTREHARFEHPRNLTSTIRVLTRALKEADTDQALRRAVDQLSSGPARLLGLADRGCLDVGAYADVVIVDPARVPRAGDSDEVTYDYPELVRSVFVNGRPAMLDGNVTETRAGRVVTASELSSRPLGSDPAPPLASHPKEATP